MAQVLQQNLRAIGIPTLEIEKFPLPVMFQKLETPGEPYDMTWGGAHLRPYADPSVFPSTPPWASPTSRREVRSVAGSCRPPFFGVVRDPAYGALDVQLASEAAPAIAAMNPNGWAFVSARTGSVAMNPSARPDGGVPAVKTALAAALLAAFGLAPAAGPQTHAGGTLRTAHPG